MDTADIIFFVHLALAIGVVSYTMLTLIVRWIRRKEIENG